MKLRILGCGTSSGVPRLGNDWGSCDPLDARNRRMRAAALVEAGGERILIDCGPDLREQLNAAGVGEVDRVIVTHDHADHLHGIDDIRQIAHNRGDQVAVYGRPELIARIDERFGYLFHGSALYPAVARLEPITAAWQLGEVRVLFCDQPHGNITSLGMRFDEGGRSIVYAIDFHAMTEEMTSLYAGVDIWVADVLRRRPHPTHAHLDAVLGWARELGVGQLVLSHMDNSMDVQQLACELPDWAVPAVDGMELGW
ncbi:MULTISPECIES: MBL fold metallo-hydrolase [Sphingomonas]|uniref:MBL fold metallo-hydrolase n=1 Tax=Sphingomonas TaxID=13687 RepID=UPI000DEF2F17|nr:MULTISPECIES: MBL fold metallo-hydrolase [Sphingomonas]